MTYFPPKAAVNFVTYKETAVTSCMPESFLIWQSLIDTATPPRDPNDEDEEEEDDREVEEDDEPAVIREPDEDE